MFSARPSALSSSKTLSPTMPVRFSTPDTLPLKYPLHHAIRDKTRSEEETMKYLRAAHAVEPACIGRPDNTGMPPIMVAIAAENLTAVNTLVELAAAEMAAGEDPLGLQMPNAHQETPLAYNVRLLRESPRFLIHDLLDDASRNITKAFIEHKLPTCTCGRCTSGWLSPRMRFRLRETAHDVYMAMLPKLDSFVEGQPLEGTVLLEDTTLQFIPVAALQQGMYKPFYVGYRCAFHVIRCFLTDTEAVPTVASLRQALALGARGGRYDSAAVEYFLERGGSVKYALDMVLHLAACLSRTPFGDGTFDARWDDAPAVLDTPASPPASRASLLLSPPLSPLLLGPPDKDAVKRRRRSSSVKEILSGFAGKTKGWSQRGQAVPVFESPEMLKYREEWWASGIPGCALDDQFIGVRYLVGLHSPPQWDVDGQDRALRRQECQLRRM